ncbi:unnamed protein product [Mortierella alpina]
MSPLQAHHSQPVGEEGSIKLQLYVMHPSAVPSPTFPSSFSSLLGLSLPLISYSLSLSHFRSRSLSFFSFLLSLLDLELPSAHFHSLLPSFFGCPITGSQQRPVVSTPLLPS